MPRSRDAHFSDLQALLEASRRLSGHASSPEATSRQYARFSLDRLDGVAAAPPAGVPAPSPSSAPDTSSAAPSPAVGRSRFDALLQRAMTLTGGDLAFVVDAHGLVVASQGALTAEEAEVLGSRLLYVLDQAAKMRLSPPSVDLVVVGCERGWLSVLRRSDVPDALTLGARGPDLLGPRERDDLVRLLGELS